MNKVPKQVVQQAIEVRDSARCNMASSRDVQRVANDMELYALVVWIEDNKRLLYDRLLLAMTRYLEEEN